MSTPLAEWLDTVRRYIVDGEEIVVIFRAFAKYVWLAAGFEVRVGDVKFFPRERLRPNSTMTRFDFGASGKRRHGIVRSLHMSQSLRRKTRYEVEIDGEVIAVDEQTMQNWYVGYLMVAVIGINAAFSLAFGSAVFRVFFKSFLAD